jgi:hypothetical protein
LSEKEAMQAGSKSRSRMNLKGRKVRVFRVTMEDWEEIDNKE